LVLPTVHPNFSDPANYSAIETLRDGRMLQIRALRPEDREDFLAAVARVGARSRYLRFFSSKRDFTEREKAFFLNVDFDKHVALIALMDEVGRKVIVGGGRYIGIDARKAEVAFVVIDHYQRRGIGSLLLRHLVIIARAAALDALVAEILPDNGPMLEVFERSGLPVITTRDAEVVHVELQLN
jgi:GNAT superfamily N-acetyltransferase